MLDLNSKSQLTDKMNLLIDAKMLEKQANQKPRSYLGGSRLGVECERALQFEFFNTPKDEGKGFSARILRIFQRGHWAEDYVTGIIKEAGFDLRTEKPNGDQYGFSVLQGKIQGHVDGVFAGGPDAIKYPALWECKCVQEKDWKACARDGVKKKYPVYWSQMQVYMAYMQLDENPAIFTAINPNNMEIYWESVLFDGAAAQRLSDKGLRIVRSCEEGVLLPKVSNDPSYYICKWCSWGERCQSL